MYRWHVTAINHGVLEESDLRIASRHGRVDEIRDENVATWDIYDDDGNWYARGVISGDYDGFEVLDDWGRGGLGATEIRIDGEVL